MKRTMKGKLTTALLVIALTLAMSAASLASPASNWPGFQGGSYDQTATTQTSSNNGTIDNGVPPTSAPTSVVQLGLATNNPGGVVYTGIDTEPVIGNGKIFTLYNGGVSGANGIGGARLAITDMQTGASVDGQVNSSANNMPILSTPYYDEEDDILYMLVPWRTAGGWILYSLTNASSASGELNSIAAGDWQPTTPITAYKDSGGQKYLFFGTWSGVNYAGTGQGAYYQYRIGAANPLTQFKPGNDDFYNTGAAFFTTSDGNSFAVFGSDGYGNNPAKVYVQPVGGSFAASANVIPMSNAYPNDKIRSSVVFDANSQCFYFTSRYTDSSTSTYTGEVWQLPYLAIFQSGTLATLAYNVTLSNASTSTPVISDNEYVYVGTYNGFTSGTVEAVSVYLFPGTPTKIIYSGGPVQASPIMYSDGDDDLIYFTTNSGTGKGYCYYFDTFNPTTPATQEWSAGGTSANPYAEQGFASDNGYLVYGDDSNNLYIMH